MVTEPAFNDAESSEETSTCPRCGHVREKQADCVSEAIISDLQLQIREISAKISEVDTEKAERSQLQADLKNLEHQLQVSMELMTNRLEQCETRFSGSALSLSQQEADSHLPALLERLNRLEDRLEKVDLISKQISSLEEGGRIESEQLLMLQDQYSLLKNEVVEIKLNVERLYRPRENAETLAHLENEILAIRKRLDQFRRILNKSA